ncbi:thioredoxin domain-containing protein [Solemya pervernicosa gill symbiont]|uniref:hypothetical protein n=1 Tax=Solemya pervernicosa gill symbiont TaxID=642797 RepID=UPI00108302F3|nr:hypothetical protein [Solemya pervernicosa gill symbiont]
MGYEAIFTPKYYKRVKCCRHQYRWEGKKAKTFSDDKGVTFPNAWRKAQKYTDNLPKKLKVPTVILVDRSGKIVVEKKGGMLLGKIEGWANQVLQ